MEGGDHALPGLALELLQEGCKARGTREGAGEGGGGREGVGGEKGREKRDPSLQYHCTCVSRPEVDRHQRGRREGEREGRRARGMEGGIVLGGVRP